MKKQFPFILIASAISMLLAGCGGPAEEASGTVPWDSPASFEGAGPGLPQITEHN